jgi:tetratricopeptide (TPR) repeat protein
MNIISGNQNTEGAVDFNPMTEFREGVELLKNEYPQKALAKLRRAYECDKHNPYFMSFLGLSIARAQRKWEQASDLCELAVQLNPKEIQFYLNLGEVYASSGRRERALDKLDDALKLFGEDKRLRQARSRVQNRRNPIVPFFGREHFLNRELGKLRHGALKYLVKDAK